MTRRDAASPSPIRKRRCAVYTRKSTDEGLEKEFNSLDAQRESCEAYIASQRSEGWVLVHDRYDDGGVSGGTLERPALKRLLADIEAGLVDVVVVYKIDRLSRSLMDFAKLVQIFDQNEVTFVSVTQSFNTTTSMGRLTLPPPPCAACSRVLSKSGPPRACCQSCALRGCSPNTAAPLTRARCTSCSSTAFILERRCT
jgi:hypothetical protein